MAAKDNFFYPKKTLKIRGKVVVLSDTWIMGIINLTPDSFYDGGQFTSEKAFLEKAESLVLQGADVLDLGAYSSRPRAEDISEEEEVQRLLPALKKIRKAHPEVYISIDTFRPNIMKMAVEEGADIINDISGGQADPETMKMVSKLDVPYIMMHMRGTPQNMHTLTNYKDLLSEIVLFFEKQIKNLQALGHNDIIIDPGIGFSKTIGQNYEILKNLDYFNVLKHPLLVGISRKSLIYKTLGVEPENSLNGTTVLNTVAVLKGASLLRVHDVREAKEVVELVKKLSH